MLRVLVVGEAEKTSVRKLFEFASQPENIYRPGPGVAPPGGNPNYVLQLWDFRCVFTITASQGKLWKHLSVSVPAPNKLPNPAAVEEIARLFGITGSLEDWAKKGRVAPHERERCMVVVSEYKL